MAAQVTIPLTLEPQPEGGFAVRSPALPALITEGDTEAEALENAWDAPLPPGPDASGALYGPMRHRSGEGVSYIDGYSGPAPVFFKYRGCPLTKRGAFRLTVYRARAYQVWHALVVKDHGAWQRYSRTVVDRKTSDGAIYMYPGTPRTYYLYRVVIPGGRGCASWRLGGVSN
jgi:hypothetical protein